MTRQIERVAVLGAGVMGSGIAAHLANAGIETVLYDIVPKDAGDDPKARVAYASKGIQTAIKSKPPALFKKGFAKRITPANYDDHADLLKECDWVVEVVVERLDIKEKVFSWVAENRKPGSIVSSNTSGIKLADMADDMDEEMRKHFLITHFFNPVRWMKLLELVPGPDTDPEVVSTMAAFGSEVLGKGIVYGKDTPNFIANRVGTFGMASVFRHMERLGLTVEQVDKIFGQAMGRPKSAVFRTADLVGLDTLAHVFGNVYDDAPDDEKRDWFIVPSYIERLVSDGRTGQKAGAGFYKKTRVDGKKSILALDTDTLEYRQQEKVRFDSIGKARKASDLEGKLKAMVYGEDKAAQAAWAVTADTLIYSANRIPEIADDIVNIDRAMRWGFAWDAGPFEVWDAIGVAESVEKMEADGLEVPSWVKDMLSSGRESFYKREDGVDTFWGIEGSAHAVPRDPRHVVLANLKADGKVLDKNVGASLIDLGDGILGVEFHTKMNALDPAISEMYSKALDRCDAGEFRGIVVGNQDSRAFCAGANIGLIAWAAQAKQWDQIEMILTQLQSLLMRARYAPYPVVTAPFGLTLGGGNEVQMHSDVAVASGDLFAGLVEVGVGLIPGAGGCKEMVMRLVGEVPQDIDYDPNPYIQKAFEQIGLAKVTTSAEEARDMGYLRRTDKVVMDQDALIKVAKDTALGLAIGGYVAPTKRTAKVPGPSGAAAIELFLYQMHEGGFATDHDVTVGKKLAWVLTGGDRPAGAIVTEQDLLDLEREAFLSLCGEEKTLARIDHMLKTNKPLRN